MAVVGAVDVAAVAGDGGVLLSGQGLSNGATAWDCQHLEGQF